jgi:Recombinase
MAALSGSVPHTPLSHRMLTTPAYGGAYAYGRTEHTTQYQDGQPRHGSRRKPRKEWLVLMPNTHEGYVSWEQFEQIQLAIGDNVRGPEQSGAVPKRDRLCCQVWCAAGVAGAS